MPVSARTGRNHRGGLAAICGLLLGLHAAPASGQALPPLAAPTPLSASPAAGDNPLVQRGVPAEASAENAVIARDRALLNGQRLAYDRLATQLGLQRGLSDSQIEQMVSSLVIEQERVTANRYTGTITVNFNPGRVPGAGSLAAPGVQLPGAAPRPGGPIVATLDAIARYGSFAEWAELNRRLANAGPVSRIQVVTISGTTARLRLGLRSEPGVASGELAAGGVLLGPAPIGSPPGEGWRIGLAEGR